MQQDIKSKEILALEEVTDEKVHDGKMLKRGRSSPLTYQIRRRLNQFWPMKLLIQTGILGILRKKDQTRDKGKKELYRFIHQK